MTKYRNKIEIVADILEVAREGARKTHIIYQGNLSFKLASMYLEAVLHAGLLAFSGENGFYVLTEKGKLFLERFNKYSRCARNLEKQQVRVRNEMIFLQRLCFSMKNPNDINHIDENISGKYNKAQNIKNKFSQQGQNSLMGEN